MRAITRADFCAHDNGNSKAGRQRPACPLAGRAGGRTVLSISKMSPGQHDYYLDSCADSPEAYYSGHGEAPGTWAGSGAADLGLVGQVSPQDFTALFRGQDPSAVPDERGTRPRLSQTRCKVPGFDLTFSAPKSVSVLWGLGDKDLQATMRRAHDEAVSAALGHLERTAAYGRRGHAGQQRIATSGFVAGVFRHRTSREGDPNLHSHVVVANAVRGTDGKWSAPDAKMIYQQMMATSAVYRASLRENLRPLGLEWTVRRDGLAELTAVPAKVLRAFSKRRVAIEERLAKVGRSGPVAAQKATLDTRPAKGTVEIDTLEYDWLRQGELLGWSRAEIDQLLAQGRERPAAEVTGPKQIASERAAAVAAVLAPTGLTEQASSFDERDVLRALAAALPSGIAVEDLTRLTRQMLSSHPEVVALPHAALPDAATPAPDRPLPVGLSKARWTTRELLATEAALVDSAVAARDAYAALVSPELIDQALTGARGGLGLHGEQAEMVRALTTTGDGVAVVLAPAGCGKTVALGAAVRAWQSDGVPVIGTALSAKAAGLLADETGMATFTTTRLLMDLRDPRWTGLAPGTVLIVDEAGQLGTRTIAELQKHVTAAAGKLVLVGDDRQLPEIHAGGAFRALAERLPVIRLTENRRQVDPQIRARLLQLRSGADPAGALAAWDRDGLVFRATDVEDLGDQMTADWARPWLAAESSPGRTVDQARASVAMLAGTNAEARQLNDRARLILAEMGVLSGPELVTDHGSFQAGDHVVTRANDRWLKVKNGDRWIVQAVDLEAGTVALRALGPGQSPSVVLPTSYLQDLQHGYALTTSISQGQTLDVALVRGSESTYREQAYVAASRARIETRFYVVGAPGQDLGCDHHHGAEKPVVGDPFVAFQQAAGRSRAKSLAADTLSAAEVRWSPGGHPDAGELDIA